MRTHARNLQVSPASLEVIKNSSLVRSSRSHLINKTKVGYLCGCLPGSRAPAALPTPCQPRWQMSNTPGSRTIKDEVFKRKIVFFYREMMRLVNFQEEHSACECWPQAALLSVAILSLLPRAHSQGHSVPACGWQKKELSLGQEEGCSWWDTPCLWDTQSTDLSDLLLAAIFGPEAEIPAPQIKIPTNLYGQSRPSIFILSF